MNVSYVFDDLGNPEYAIVPIKIWQKMKWDLDEETVGKQKSLQNKFIPKDYRGLLSNRNLDIEQEILEMRAEWIRDI